MTDADPKTDNRNPTPDPQEQNPAPTGGGDAQKTYTESEITAMVAARLAKQEKALKAQYAEEAKTAAERAKLDEVERVKAEKADLEKKAADAEARAIAAERRAALTGKVADASAALKLLDPEKHLDSDGNVNTEALLTDYPFLKPTTPGATPIGGANPRGQKDSSLMSDEEFFTSRTKQP